VLFFVSVGMLFEWKTLMETPWLALATIFIVLIVKPLSAIVIAVLLRYPLGTALSVGAVLSQIGEFSFIVGTIGKQYDLVSESAFNTLVATAIVSITLSPLMFKSVPWLERAAARHPKLWALLNRVPKKADLNADERNHSTARKAVIVGYGPVGKTVKRLLVDNGFSPSVVEMNLDTVQQLRANGIPAFFGDASHPDTLKAAGITSSDILILSSSSIPLGREIIQEAKRMNPSIRVIARTAYLREADDLLDAGATAVFSGEGEVALSITEKILEAFGATAEQIDRAREHIRKDLFNAEQHISI
jgi:CPA2 family monovalent cation:H+ antiporter-2